MSSALVLERIAILVILILNITVSVGSLFANFVPFAKDYDEVQYLTQNISDEVQRNISSQQLLYCPLLPLCNNVARSRLYVHNVVRSRLVEECCKPCSCNVDMAHNGYCPNHKLFTEKLYQSCIRPQYLIFGQSEVNTDHSYYMITRCLEDFKDDAIKQKCTSNEETKNDLHLSSFVPVTSNKNGVTYKNYYCAICNNENHLDLLDWRAQISCRARTPFHKAPSTEHELLQIIKKDKFCNILFEQTVSSAAECDWGHITTCNQTGKWKHYDRITEQGCLSYTSLYRVHDDDLWYKNVFCFMCNEDKKPILTCGGSSISPPVLPISFTSLIHYRKPSEISSDINRCKEDEFFDIYKNMCQTVECPPYSAFVDNACKLMFNLSPRRIYQVFYNSTITTRYKCQTKSCRDHLVSVVENAIKLKFNFTASIKIRAFICLSNMSYNNETIVIFNLTLKVNKPHDQRKYLNMLTSVQKVKTMYNYAITNLKVKIKVISKMAFEAEYSLRTKEDQKNSIGKKKYMDMTGDNSDVSEHCDSVDNAYASFDDGWEFYSLIGNPLDLDSVDKPWHLDSFDNLYNAFYDFVYRGLNHSREKESINIVHVTSNYFCPRLKFKIEDVIISKTELLLPNVNVKYNLSDIIRHGNYVMVCLGPYAEAANRTNAGQPLANFTEEILSLICSTVSIISLILTVVVYSFFKELRTVPGINNMILSVHLILANLFYMSGTLVNSYYQLCTAFGILTHYLWLSSIMWMHCCSIHMFRVFVFMMEIRNINKSMRAIALYTVYVTATSVIFVTSNIVYSVAISADVQNKTGYLGYGGEACYISNPKMILITFVVPVGIILLSNAVLFCIVIYRIHKQPTLNAANRKSRNNFIIYIKLTCLTGLSWIFGFIYKWTLLHTFSYIFIALNASQGLFIFISFCCSARVRNMCRSKFLQRTKRKKSANKESKL